MKGSKRGRPWIQAGIGIILKRCEALLREQKAQVVAGSVDERRFIQILNLLIPVVEKNLYYLLYKFNEMVFKSSQYRNMLSKFSGDLARRIQKVIGGRYIVDDHTNPSFYSGSPHTDEEDALEKGFYQKTYRETFVSLERIEHLDVVSQAREIAWFLISGHCPCGRPSCSKEHNLAAWLTDGAMSLDIFIARAVMGYYPNTRSPEGKPVDLLKNIPKSMGFNYIKDDIDLAYSEHVLFSTCSCTDGENRHTNYEGIECYKCGRLFDERSMKRIRIDRFIRKSFYRYVFSLWKCGLCGTYFPVQMGKGRDRCPVEGCSYVTGNKSKISRGISMHNLYPSLDIDAEPVNVSQKQTARKSEYFSWDFQMYVESCAEIKTFLKKHFWMMMLVQSIIKHAPITCEEIEKYHDLLNDIDPLELYNGFAYSFAEITSIAEPGEAVLRQFKRELRKVEVRCRKKRVEISSDLNDVDLSFQEIREKLKNFIVEIKDIVGSGLRDQN